MLCRCGRGLIRAPFGSVRSMHIEQIWRYPVKSVGGELLEAASVTNVGIEGDRAWAVQDNSSGAFLTGRRQPELLMATATVVDGQAVLTLPDGTETNDDGELSTWLGKDVSLVRAAADSVGTYEIQLDFETETGEWFQWQGPAGSFHDSTVSQVSLVSTFNLRDWDRRRFRTNIILDGASVESNEDHLVESSVEIGSAKFLVTKAIDRCIMVTRPQPDGIERDLDVLRTINAERATLLSVGAMIETAGQIAVGDQLQHVV